MLDCPSASCQPFVWEHSGLKLICHRITPGSNWSKQNQNSDIIGSDCTQPGKSEGYLTKRALVGCAQIMPS
ncbi:hypothetical protein BB560_000300 [Smittium megazygosporum]|uniref:Uncharacterized protein n=1 Tax=Smittium megazygosporum TaxID=133381 RepID=A0A2T9ZKU7_9FUNG|nr:hypothetical protein BB560_000300 [Smittium megazygosporum]